MAGRPGLRAGGAGDSERGDRLARRHSRHLSAHQSLAGADGVLRRRTGIAAAVRPADPDLTGGDYGSHDTAGWGVGTLEEVQSPKSRVQSLGTLLDYLPAETVFLLCEPELLAERANEYAQQVPEEDPFFILWEVFQAQARERGMILLEANEAEPGLVALGNDEEAEASSGAPFPLTPALSPGERENAPPVGEESELGGRYPASIGPSPLDRQSTPLNSSHCKHS